MITPEQFNNDIENLSTHNMSVMDAILHYCDINNLEFETVSVLIDSNLKFKLRLEAEDLHFIPKTSKLPI